MNFIYVYTVYYTTRNILYLFFIAQRKRGKWPVARYYPLVRIEHCWFARIILMTVLMNNDISDNNAGSAEHIVLPLLVCKLVVYLSHRFVI